MSSWKRYELKYLCEGIIDCVNKTAPISSIPTEYKMLRTSDIRDGRINLENLNCVSFETFKKWTRRGELKQGDIVFTREAPLGEVGLVKEAKNLFLGQRLVLFRANKDVCDNRFLLYALMYYDNKQAIISKGVGSTVLHLRVPECEKITISAPNLITQRRIADILSAYDDLIENNRKQIKLLEEAAQRLYKEWFVDLRFPGHEHTKIVDDVPEGWGKLHISDVCDTIGGGTPSTKVKEYYQNGSIPWVTPTDITKNNSLVLLDTAAKITNEGLNNSSAKMVPPGTILMTSRASVGFFGICNFPVCTNQGFISCVPYQHDAQMYLLYNLLNRVDEIRTKAGGSTYLEISKKTFRDFEIVVPDTQVLTLFQITAEKSIEQIRILSTQILKLQQARDRLLPKLMSGEVEV